MDEMGAIGRRGPVSEASEEKPVRKLREGVKEKFVRVKGYYVPSLHEKYLHTEEDS